MNRLLLPYLHFWSLCGARKLWTRPWISLASDVDKRRILHPSKLVKKRLLPHTPFIQHLLRRQVPEFEWVIRLIHSPSRALLLLLSAYINYKTKPLEGRKRLALALKSPTLGHLLFHYQFMTLPTPRLGIVSALREEQTGLIEAMQQVRVEHVGMRDYTCGTLWGIPVVCVLARLGKVAAAATTATLIERFGTTELLFTGVAGAVATGLRPGDVVIADTLVQHDMDASPLFPRYQIPLLGQTAFAADTRLSNCLAAAAQDFLASQLMLDIAAEDREAFALVSPAVRRGLVASGDEFVDSHLRLEALRGAFSDLLAVEMEGAAVAQVCYEFDVPFAVIRTISDGANEDAQIDFLRFVERVAGRYAYGILHRLLHSGFELKTR
jgi:adenosylhomocysteine nucleosidase